MNKYIRFVFMMIFSAIFIWLISPNYTRAIPSFARQTNLTCNTCHTIFPELNAFGRQFKRMGYTLVTVPSIQATADTGEVVTLRLPSSSPISSMLMTSFSLTKKAQPGTQNNNLSFPQQLSLFLAGSITPKVGGFLQVTYDQQSGVIGMDNAELRYADQTELFSQNFVYGLTLNNNPTVEDLWNSLPAWRYPFAASATSPAPSAATLLEGGLSQNVLGLGVYGLWNDLIYADVSLYRSAIQGGHNPPDSSSSGVLKGVAPYWRLALQEHLGDYYVELGTFGLAANQYSSGIAGTMNKYTDIGFDLNIEKSFGDNQLTAHGSYIHEKLSTDSSSVNALSSSTALNSFNAVVNYILHSQVGFSVGYFSLNGDNNPGLYSASAVSGSANGSPNSSGLIFEFDYLPWLNTKLALQYVAYNKFNGGTDNYDGSGRNASDNNTLYLLCWVAF